MFLIQNSFRRRVLPALIAGVVGASSWLLPHQAIAGPGDLLVTPTRVVLEGRERSAELTLVNRGQERTTYRITLENRRMDAQGKFSEIDTPKDGELFAQNLIRYAPRRVTLEPNKPQTIRVLLRKPADLEDGEYRSHLYFSAIPDGGAGDSVEAGNSDDNAISIKLTPVYGVTIPIIVRNGTLDAGVNIAEAKLYSKNGKTEGVNITLERDGNRSVYGDISVATADNPEDVLALLRGVAVYVPNDTRNIRVPFAEDKSIPAGREVVVKFEEKGAADASSSSESKMVLR